MAKQILVRAKKRANFDGFHRGGLFWPSAQWTPLPDDLSAEQRKAILTESMLEIKKGDPAKDEGKKTEGKGKKGKGSVEETKGDGDTE